MSRVWRASAIQYRKKILSARHVLLYNLPSLWSANSSCKRASQDIYMFLFGRNVYHDSNVFVLVLRSMGFHSSLTFRSSICYSDGYYRCYFNYTKYKIFKLIKSIRIFIQGKDIFGILIINLLKRGQLSLQSSLVPNCSCRKLDVPPMPSTYSQNDKGRQAYFAARVHYVIFKLIIPSLLCRFK